MATQPNNFPAFCCAALCVAALSVATIPAFAQLSAAPPAVAPATTASPAQLDTVSVTGRAAPTSGVTGFGDLPLAKAPFQASVVNAEQMRDRGVYRLSDLTKLDPAVSDAYNTEGYWDYLTVRGFVIDNRFNYRRDGLPINAETSIPLDNKESIAVLKSTSGLQAGTSAPGGLVDFSVKRPTAAPLRELRLARRERGSLLASADLSQRFGTDAAFGLRVNAAVEHLAPKVRDAHGDRRLFALAGDWQLSRDALLEAEVETSHRRQPSVPGFSLLGSRVPSPVDPRINLNNQPWSLPVVLDGTTGSLRYTQKLSADWRVSAHAATQRLRSDDRIAFPFGCSAEDDYTRYCSDGSYDLYDFRSENERRRTDALELAVDGRFDTGGIRHTASAGVLQSRVRNRFQRQAYNDVGSGNVAGTLFTPADGSLTDENTNRSERSTELFARDALKLTDALTAWLGARHTRLSRASVRTDGSRPTTYEQSFTSPFAALSVALSTETLVYASWGRGLESDVAPNRQRYSNAGEALSGRSRQVEAGLKVDGPALGWGVAYFDIERVALADVPNIAGGCDSDAVTGACTRRADGTQRHRGVEADVRWQSGAWLWQGGAQWLQARRDSSVRGDINGKRPTNVPAATLKLGGRYEVSALPGLALGANLVAEGDRMVLEDNSLRIPGWARVDAQMRYAMRTGRGTDTGIRELVWRAGIDNLLDRRAWRESPLQFGHSYLFPLAPRTLSLSVEAAL